MHVISCIEYYACTIVIGNDRQNIKPHRSYARARMPCLDNLQGYTHLCAIYSNSIYSTSHCQPKISAKTDL